MTGRERQTDNLTDDEAELVTIIKGLEGQASDLERRIQRARHIGMLCSAAALAAVSTIAVSEVVPKAVEVNPLVGAGIASLASMGGLVQTRRRIKLNRQKTEKLNLATRLIRELEPPVIDDDYLGRFEED